MGHMRQIVLGGFLRSKNTGAGIISRTRSYCKGQFKVRQHLDPQFWIFQKLKSLEIINSGIFRADGHEYGNDQSQIMEIRNPGT